ncbi:amino acid transporter [Basidiobolus meristosporus CBS 931.73]|uniref:Amino acid transporter n=1 Tax=Basidiobolus meristosporus CBS 931.73 TaxID=1314790 RepID=A0A1Y1XND8_9FUNG|nr:amino acid transporter [Basidiobolus meristosporus CBS 931.73]|eukprot:ORX87016.1 amino acid transporter [Basidiobolus meristosporus CBS 931.73]
MEGKDCKAQLHHPREKQHSIKSFKWWEKMLLTKSIERLQADAKNTTLERTHSAADLTAIGIGGTIGIGIFVLTGLAAAKNTGPAVVLSFILAGLTASTAAFSLSEMACIIPVSGSTYTYVYATLGELAGWVIGWDLILEYLVGAATVSVGWSNYFRSFLMNAFGIQISERYTSAPVIFDTDTQSFNMSGSIINVPAILISLTISTLLYTGVRESARVNTVIVITKLLVIVLFITACLKYVDPKNYTPFLPPNQGSFGLYGFSGLLSATTTVFFSYIGFDSVTTAAQEAKNPERDVPIGIWASLIICAVLYIAMCMIMTGIVPYHELNSPSPVSVVIAYTGMSWLTIIVEFAAIIGLTSVMIVLLLAQSRIFYTMACDGLLPSSAAKIHKKFKTPWVTTIASGAFCALLGGVLPVDVLGEMSAVGTLFAFALVHVGVIILRFRRPELPRKFKTPLGPFAIPIFGIAMSVVLICGATISTILRLFIWMAVGLLVYILYGRTHSKICETFVSLHNHEMDSMGRANGSV